MADKSTFDAEGNIAKWNRRFKRWERFVEQKSPEATKEEFLDSVETVVNRTQSKSGETKAGYAKPLIKEGRVANLKLNTDPDISDRSKEKSIERGLKKSLYKYGSGKTRAYYEVVNTVRGAYDTEFGDSKKGPQATVRQEAEDLRERIKERFQRLIKEVKDK